MSKKKPHEHGWSQGAQDSVSNGYDTLPAVPDSQDDGPGFLVNDIELMPVTHAQVALSDGR